MSYILACTISLVFFGILGVVAYISRRFTNVANENAELKAGRELDKKIIAAMKRAVQNQAYLHGKLEEISNAKTAAELNAVYASIFK